MDKLLPFIWILSAIALYGVAWGLLVEAMGVARRRKGGPTLAGLSLMVLAAAFVPVPLPWRLLFVAGMGAALLVIYHRLWVPKARTGPEFRERKEDRRQAALHLALLTGGAIFIVPFVWLVTTSLKEDEEIFKFPPAWVPRQQVQVRIGNQPVGLARLKPTGQYVVQLRESETSWTVQPYSPEQGALVPGSRPLEVTKGDLEKVKAFDPRWENYTEALTFLPPETLYGAMYLWNTVLVTVLNIVGVLLSSSLVAFAFARLRWPGRDLLFILMLSTMMLPAAVTLIPVFLIYRGLGWVDTLHPLWVTAFFAAPFNVFLLRQFFLTIPNDLEDAAKIDGCSYFRIYWNIMLPLTKPALAALTIFAFMGSWNNFMGPLIYISSPEKMTLAYALRLFQSAHSSEYGML
ncbi:MAG: carbohydrate ABC transporter permease, partial [Armatimonadetes bacterium]|nr:carbohydrate ABC transporter permease [Armatimonadota bacterium]